MNFRQLLLPAGAAGILLLSGCVNAGPNAQQGAFTGAALGAIAGAVIGNNSNNHNGGDGAMIGAVAGALLGGAIGDDMDRKEAEARRDAATVIVPAGTPATGPVPDTSSGYTRAVPPPLPARPAEVISPQTSDETVWVAGFWAWTGNEYMWVKGHWEIPPPKCTGFVAPHWKKSGSYYSYVQGYWY